MYPLFGFQALIVSLIPPFGQSYLVTKFDSSRVTIDGDDLVLPLKEFELLHLLLANAGRVLPRDTLIDRIWGHDYVGDTKTLDVHVKRLRSKLEADPSHPVLITTIRGLGYKYSR